MNYLTPTETAQFLRANAQALFIDTRSDREFRFVGHPVGARHVPWQDELSGEINPQFVATVQTLADTTRDLPLILICRSGERAREAGQALAAAGFSRIHVVRHGFEGDVGDNFQRGGVNGWRCDGLPWEISVCTVCRS